MTTEFNPLIASDTGAGSATTKCTPSNRGTEPTLKEMTEKAISLLQGNPKGFVLQVEGASIDKRDHSADACGQIGELLGMDDAIGVAQEFQRTHPDTLIVVTADHSHTPDHPGHARSRAAPTRRCRPSTASRSASPTAPPRSPASQAHTGSTVPVFASGPRAADIVGTIDQTELFPVLTNTQTAPGRPTPTPVGGDVGGNVPATLALTVGARGDVRPFRPGRGQRTTPPRWPPTSSPRPPTRRSASPTPAPTPPAASSTARSRSPRPLETRAKDGAFAPVGGSAAPTTLLTWTGPVSNDAMTIDFKQSIGANEALRTGAYAKTLTLTLTTTTP